MGTLLLLCAIGSFLTCPSNAEWIGKEFALSFLQNYIKGYDDPHLQLYIVAAHADAKVSVQIPSLDFVEEKTLEAGKATTVILPTSAELYDSMRSSSTVRIKASADVAVMALTSKRSTGETSVIYPITDWGVEYFVFTPQKSPAGTFKVFSVTNGKESNTVVISPKAAITFEGKAYASGSQIKVQLKPYESAQFQSVGDLSGTRVSSTHPVAVFSGHTCTWMFSRCNQVYEQLLPVSAWGSTFMVPSLSFQTKYDSVYILASQTTRVTIKGSKSTPSLSLVSGQVELLKYSTPESLYIEADHGIQVLLLFNGVTMSNDKVYDPFLVTILPSNRFCSSYSFEAIKGFENKVLIVAKTSALALLRLDNANLPSSVQWKQIVSTDYSWTEMTYKFNPEDNRHILSSGQSPFAVYSIGVTNRNGYGAPAMCVSSGTCSTVRCGNDQVCEMKGGSPVCVPKPATCWAAGDPHYRTFDGRRYDFMGTCTYVIAKKCSEDNDLQDFEVLAQNENRGNTRVSYVGLVVVKVYGITVTIVRSERGRVRINNSLWTLPAALHNNKLKVFQSGRFAVIETDFGLTVRYDWRHKLDVTLPGCYAGKTCGLCGNFNGDPVDDFKTPSGTQASTAVAFGGSWKVPGPVDNNGCKDDCQGGCDTCKDGELAKWAGDSYCGLIKLRNGPFSKCHAIIDPQGYVENCQFDLCMGGGLRQFLCDALEAYAQDCQAAGIQIQDWRTNARCSPTCPANSHYEICGSACPATCSDPKAPSKCKRPCVETCTCNDGFVLSGDKCVPSAACGCTYEGRYIPAGKTFWADDDCRRLCKCSGESRRVECEDRGCGAGQQCQVVNGIRKCQPLSYGICKATGDPHYMSFDNVRFDFQGTCVYQLAALCSKNSDLVPFEVLVQNENRGNRAVSITKLVEVKVYSISIIITKTHQGLILVNNELQNLPVTLNEGKVNVYRSGFYAVVTTDFGLKVIFNWRHAVFVTLPSNYKGAVCGLCGNYNDDGADDLIPKNGGKPVSAKDFGASWRVAEIPGCVDGCQGVCPVCDIKEKVKYEGNDYCGIIRDPKGPFRDCHAKIDPAAFFEDCVFDVCLFRGRKDILCQAITAYTSACQDQGLEVYNWRASQFCAVTCPANSHYEICPSGCPATCKTLAARCASTRCQEGCVCDKDHILSGDICVPLSECGCIYKDRYYKVGETFYPNGKCELECECAPGGEVVCKKFTCGPNEECKIVGGIQKCHPKAEGVCLASGDPHYTSFDGKRFDFQGTCTYTLSKSSGLDGTHLVPFSIKVENTRWDIAPRNRLVSVTKLVAVEVYGLTVILRSNTPGVLVNGLSHHLPFNYNNGQVQIYQEGRNHIISTNFGLRVTYDLVYQVTVTVPSTYYGKVSGLCGNFNGDQNDDFQTPDNTITTNVNEFGKSWKVPIPNVVCEDGCEGKNCPQCDAARKDAFSKISHCGIITAPKGPFAVCHSKLNPQPYFDDCLFDLCASNGDGNTLCDSVAAYVLSCHLAGVHAIKWRTPSFCPMKCPANTHYDVCVNPCTDSCPGLTDTVACPAVCAEGCECDAGLLFNGQTCVKETECGCYHNGRTYTSGEVVFGEDCSKKCTCLQGGAVFCEDHKCPQGSKCMVENGIRKCQETATCSTVRCGNDQVCEMKGGSPVCVPKPATCWAAGDPHYHTFDGRRYDFMGTCTYVIAKKCSEDNDLQDFEVLAQNENRGNTRVSYVGLVVVKVYGITVTIVRSERGRVRINNSLWTLPAALHNNKLKVFQSGRFAVIETDFGLTVRYDWRHKLDVTLPGCYAGKTCGLCGNFNGDPVDDFKTPSGTQASTAVAFGGSWKVLGPVDNNGCKDDCQGGCDTCKDGELAKWAGDSYCGLIKLRNGPFSKCHAIIDPQGYVENCQFDLCMGGGLRQFLCDALEAYAQDCQAAGIQIQDWRTKARCSPTCPAHSHYEICGSACPATCSDPKAPSKCKRPCVETCTCNDGFVLSGDKCVPSAACGCTYEGRYIPAGKTFWADDDCRRLCKCSGESRRVECEDRGCGAGQQCQVVNGIRKCQPLSYGICKATGDPHYMSFDNVRFDFQGTCVYQLAALCSKNSDLVPFEVLVQNENRGNRAVSITKLVEVKVYSISIIITKTHQGLILVNNELQNLPVTLNEGKVNVYRSGFYAVVTTDFGLKVIFNWRHAVFVTLPSNYKGAVCGLCGNYNDDGADDLIPKNGGKPVSAKDFGASWRVAEIPGCVDGCQGACPVCDIKEKVKYEGNDYCGIIRDPKGPFRDCHAKIDPAAFFEDCVFDVCLFRGRKDILCQAITAYTSACQDQGLEVYNWRASQFCAVTCPANSHYEICPSGCPATCKTLAARCASTLCQEGCVCDKDHILSGDICVPLSECGCIYKDRYYKVGETFYPNGKCELECECAPGGEVVCKKFTCGPNEECKIVGGIQKCHPKAEGVCLASGDPHYTSFDGKRFDFQGTCTYTLSKSSGLDGTHLVPFSIKVENTRWDIAPRNRLVSVTKLVAVEVYGLTVILRSNTPGVLVNGLSHHLPFNYNNGQVQIYQEGRNHIISTNFGLRVTYDLVYQVTVTVPSTYYGKVSGLCGNFNGDQNDDFQTPDNTITTNVNEFGKSWKVPIPNVVCEDGCEGKNCPQCDAARKDAFSKISHCGIITAPKGPFAVCHSKLNPQPYFDDCLFDLCASNGDGNTLCDSVAAYVLSCHLAGVHAIKWRTPSFCPMKCPANTHYDVCVNPCTDSCPGLTDTVACPAVCAEGCECDAGLLFNGQTCVKETECGCYHNGRTYTSGEVVFGEDCSKKCTCLQGGAVFCEDHKCPQGSKCMVENGIRKCQETATCSTVRCGNDQVCEMKGGSPVCVPKPATCWAAGDPHYHTFDGRRYDFMGTCTYVIAKKCSEDNDLQDFEVLAQNENRGNTRVSYVGLVVVKVYGITVTIVRSERGRVRINNSLWTLPAALHNNKLKVFQSGRFAVIETDFGLTVRYDWRHKLDVTLPGCYAGKTCGLCGNFNGDPVDDFKTPSGTQASTAVAFGGSWKVLGPVDNNGCKDDCQGGCDTCKDGELAKWAGDSYCGLIKLRNGPFSKCHAIIDPQGYVENCQFDLCMGGGLRQFLCDALEAYAQDCQAAGIQIQDWRTKARCSPTCPAHSHYEICGSACPATCSDPKAPSKCKRPCVETCTCNDGFVLSGDKCVPSAACGCTYEGRYIPAGKTFWADDDCRRLCKCSGESRRVECEDRGCGAGQQCQVVNGIRKCQPLSYGICKATGDPHYMSFDNVRFDFQGTCVYQLAALCSKNSDLVPFEVLVQNENRGNRAVSITKLVEVKVYSISIIITKTHQGLILVNNELQNLPVTLNEGKVNVYRSGFYAVVTTDFGLKVIFNWRHAVFVTLPSNYKGAVCGLCGNYNDDGADDLIPKNGGKPVSAKDFGASWRVAEIPGCVDGCQGACPVCDIKEKVKYEGNDYCGIIRDPKGPFRDCHAKIDPAAFFEDCVFDVCLFRGRKDILCQAITAYTSACQDQGLEVYNWRASQFCAVTCPANSHYEICPSGCPATCKTLAARCASTLCQEGCVCDKDHILSGDICVPLSECGCIYKDRYYKVGETFYPNGKCELECECAPGGEVVCKKFTCGPNEECKIVGGIQKCHPKAEGVCLASGDPHYTSFDGKRFDFQGTCTYTLSKSSGLDGTHLVPFSIKVENTRWDIAPRNRLVSVTKLVAVEVYGLTVILRSNTPGVLVNGLSHHLPFNYNNGQVQIYQEGRNHIISTNFGLRVTYDLVYQVTVTVPSTYYGKVSGLCGNFNGDQNDDFQTPDNTITTNVNEFGKSWKVPIPNVVCEDGCEGKNCPQCDAARKDAFSKISHCGIITAPKGPFAVCHSKLNPQPYFDDCLFDLCASNGDGNTLCDSVAAYVLSCHLAGVHAIKWRTPSFCPMKCPANTHYDVCVNPCTDSCPGLTDTVACPAVCAEGCECDAGLLFNGQTCVKETECGCYHNGRTYTSGEVVFGEDCSKKCTCLQGGAVVCEDHKCPQGSKCMVENGIRKCQTATCSTVRCGNDQVCEMKGGSPVCVPKPATCWAAGDPHYHTFDGRRYNFMGTCTYVIAKKCSEDNDLQDFEVLAQNENRGNTRVSYVGLVVVKVYGITVTIVRSERGQVRINNSLWTLPAALHNNKLKVFQSGRFAVIETDFGLTVRYDWRHKLDVTLPGCYAGKTCGLCGNFNGDPVDDFKTPSGTQASTAVAFGGSWKVLGPVDNNGCKDDCQGGCDTCKDGELAKWAGDSYCGLIKLRNGPFSKCHAIIDPQGYVENCQFDLCMGGGLRQFLCDALEAYAQDCQAAGIQIQDWRTKARCSPTCPANSHYEICGSACPATCSDPKAPSKCKRPCVETCTCNDGFVLSGDKCVPSAACGCTYEGRYIPAGKTFWADDDCRRLCKCSGESRRVECEDRGCGAGQQCQVVNGIRKCQPLSYGICKATGDPHYMSFDNVRFDFQGTCVYQLAALCSKNSDLVPFEVLVQNENRGNRAVSITKLVEVKVYSISIIITKTHQGLILVNNELQNLPVTLNEGKVNVYRSGFYAVVTTDFGLKVIFNWRHAVFVTLPSNYKGAVCGLCGNYNDDGADDLIPKNGGKPVSAKDFGASWRVAEIPGCVDGCQGACPVCDIKEKVKYEGNDYCGIIRDPKGPFRDCHAKIDPAAFFEDCVFDVCLFRGRKDILCQAITAYTSACQDQGLEVYNWRASQFCAVTCPANSHYEICPSGCPATCKTLAARCASTLCQEGCVCDKDHILSGDICVPLSECGCIYKDRYYKVGETFYPNGKCELECECAPGGEVVCKKFTCGPNEECKIVGGIQKCHPKAEGVCLASGDPHYTSFDGKRFDFQGTCTYTLSKSSGLDGTHLVPFSIKVENTRWDIAPRNRLVSVTKLVAVEVYGLTVILRSNTPGVLVNGLSHHLPFNYNNGQVQIYQEGRNHIISTNFGLRVTYDLVYQVTVTVPSTYYGKVSGLCGNFNGDQNDDFQTPDNTITTNVNEFGKSWKVPIPNVVCEDGCEGKNCPQCDAARKDAFSKISHCGIITAPKGPFAVCHSKLNPQPYFDDCLFDLCASNGDGNTLCDSVAAYVLSCHLAGVHAIKWRTPSFCPMKCPANTHYDVCVNPCTDSCPGLTDTVACPAVCAEGCECDAGLLFNGQTCVKETECGCYHNGRTYTSGEVVFGEDCSKKCTCLQGGAVVCEDHKCPQGSKCMVENGIRKCQTATCSTVRCGNDQVCEMKGGSPVCVPKPATCWAAGDPHYHTFDGRRYNFMGTCTYVIAKKCSEDNDLQDFEVLAQNENRGNTRVSYVGLVVVKVYGITVTIVRSERGQVRINNSLWTLPAALHNNKLKVFQSGRFAVIETDFGLTVRYDWRHKLDVTLPGCYAGKTCGLCGNFNGDPVDDFKTPSGTQASTAVAFGGSWKVLGPVDNNGCKDDCQGGCDTCKDGELAKWAGDSYCGLIKLRNGPFSKCHAIIDPQGYVENCQFDLCMGGGLRQFLCDALEAYAQDCQAAGIQIQDWRTKARCSPTCPANSHYEICGSACPATCSDPKAPSKCKRPCVETCTCNDGFVLSGDKCVPSAACGCTYEGRYIPAGKTFWADDDCRRLCKCSGESRRVECEDRGCGAGQQCQVVNGIRKCQPLSYGICKATGDPHYMSFDNVRFDFQGTCVYQLAALCSKNSDLVPFEVLVQNENRGNRAVSITKLVEVKVYSISIIITKTHQGLILVNNELQNLPVTLNEGKVNVYRSGFYAVVTTDFGLKVIFNWRHAVFVTLPSNYKGAVCGLCGNYNDDGADDLIPKNGGKPVSAKDFGASWRVAEIPGCVDGCQGACPVCDIKEKVKYEGNDYCGIIRDPKGPFRDCHAKIDPAAFFEDCVFDVCLFRGRKDILCQAITAYTSACQDQGLEVYNWRASQFCAVTCPANSHYEICPSGCPATCKTLAARCASTLCQEGCVCNKDHILSGDICVPLSECGCIYKDRYYKVGETFYPNGKCELECECAPGGEVVCKKFTCGPNEECKIVGGIQKCHPKAEGVCLASGDPHYTSFDGKRFDFQGTCTYTLSKSSGLDGTHLVPFSIKVENTRWDIAPRNRLVSVTKLVAVEVYGLTVILRSNTPGVLVNGLSHHLPFNYNNGQVRIYQEGRNHIISTNFGLRVTYDLVYQVTVTVPSTYYGKVSGLCGNFNGDQNDDFQTPDNTITTNVNEFGKSWKVPIPNVVCEDGCEGKNCPKCNKARKAAFSKISHCGIITAPEGPFAVCHSKLNPQPYFDDCLFDLCASKGDGNALCDSVAAYVFSCHLAGVHAIKWRTPSFCPMECPANTHFGVCVTPCTDSCPGLTDIDVCAAVCAEGCECDAGLLFNGQKCVKETECGCYHNGRTYTSGEVVFGEDCSKKCTCLQGGAVVCEDHKCPQGSKCMVESGIRRCQDTDPCKDVKCGAKEECVVRDEKPVCIPVHTGRCWAWGDPHYKTFDGYNYNFQGTCKYIISKTSGNLNGLVPFSITETNDNRGNTAVSYVREVHISVYDFTITIQKNQVGRVTVNNVLVNLPVTLGGGKVSVSQRGRAAQVETDFGLIVIYDWNSYLEVKLPSRYHGLVAGLCGNFNGNSKDERQDPDGALVPSVVEWAKSWKTPDQDKDCSDRCEKNCPTCGETDLALYRGEAFCGALNHKRFQKCHKKVDPKPFLDNCLFDVCNNQGDKRLLCQALASYSQQCSEEGKVIKNWRKKFDCQMECPRNSHYEECGSACPRTCPNPTEPRICAAVCVEGCVCDEGFILSAGGCVPVKECGCSHEGRYYKRGQKFWADDACTRQCECDSKLGKVICRETSCSAQEKCTLVDGERACRPISHATCIASGDPHYYTFDNRRFDFQGTCVYQLVGVCSRRVGLVPFEVIVQNENRGNKAVSFTKTVKFSIYGVDLIISREHPGKILIGGALVSLPLDYNNELVAYRSGGEAVVETVAGITVSFNWRGKVSVTVPSTYQGAVCGLCGNYNGEARDDLTMRNGQEAPNGAKLGESWKVADVPGCSSGCEGKRCPTCSDSQVKVYESNKHCGIIADKAGPFRDCHKHVDPAPYVADCVYDVCQYNGRSGSLCDAVEVYVSACQSQGINIYNWRTPDFCPMACSANSHYSLCATGCPVTCANFPARPSCKRPCAEACECDEGFLLSGDTCVPVRDCGCSYNGQYYEKGAVFFPGDKCVEKCRCGKNGAVSCRKAKCRRGEVCKLLNGVKGCHPEGQAKCVASGDPHYTSFDGRRFDFQGTCVYVLAKVCNDDKGRLTPFTVTQGNEKFGNGNVAVTKSVGISVYDYIIYIQQRQPWKVIVDDELVNLPLSLDNGRVTVTQEGRNIIVRTDFGLTVLYDTFYYVEVIVPSTYQRKMCGLCGNYNTKSRDDFELPNGKRTRNVDKFGRAWVVDMPRSECGGCGGKCPKCKPVEAALYGKPNSCGIISEPNGPFKACHGKVDPAAYVSDCVFDVCAVGGHTDTLCNSVQAYALACQNEGVQIQPWRSGSFCPLSCPPNSHYEVCADTCGASCASFINPVPCSKRCFEGCQCDDGFVFDGTQCVSLDKCGCGHNGQYLTVGQTVVDKDCSSECVCQASGLVKCTKLSCGSGEFCSVRNGARGCHVTVGQCTINQTGHLSSFDGLSGAIGAHGAFVVASVCDEDSEIWFRVVVDVRTCTKGASPSVDTLYVFFREGVLSVNSNHAVWVNGIKTCVPLNVADDLSVRVSGNTVIIERKFAVRITYSASREVNISIDKGLAGKMCGACGNSNKNRKDDLKTADGNKATDVSQVVVSWSANDFSRCGLP